VKPPLPGFDGVVGGLRGSLLSRTLAQAPFVGLLSAYAISQFSEGMTQTALTWIAFRIRHGDVSLVGRIGLIQTIVPFLVLIPAGLFLGKPEYAIPVLSFSIGFAGVLALSRSYSGHFAHSVNTAIAQNTGIFLMAIMTRLLRSVGADWSVRRLYRSDLSDLALLARPSPAPSTDTANGEGQAALGRIIDRTPQLAIRLQALTPEERRLYSQSFLHPSIGRILLDVSRLQHSLPGPDQEHLVRFLEGLSDVFRKHPLPGQMSFRALRKGIRSLEDALSSGHDPLHRNILERLTALETFIPPEDRNVSPLSATGGSAG
jgi:uncharacterized membrane protein YccC